MHPEPALPLLAETVAASTRYLAALESLSDQDCRASSALPGWTRGHVINHVSRNADGLRNLLIAAQTGSDITMYLSQERRNSDIEEGAGRSAAEIRADATESAQAWLAAAQDLDPDRLEVLVHRTPGADGFPVRGVTGMRRTEIEVHHADLLIGYTAHEWPADFADYLMASRIRDLSTRDVALTLVLTDIGTREPIGEGGMEISGDRADVLWWLLGRGMGEELTSATGELPELPPWR